MKVLLIDDARSEKWVEIAYGVPVTQSARTFAEGINALKNDGPFDLLFLDHDLASYDEEGNELTGYKIMLFLEENPEYLPKDIVIVSSNPVGRAKMQTVIDQLYQK